MVFQQFGHQYGIVEKCGICGSLKLKWSQSKLNFIQIEIPIFPVKFYVKFFPNEPFINILITSLPLSIGME